MRIRNVALAMVLALSVAGCAGLADRFDKSVFSGGLSVTATVQNPVTREQQAAVEVSYQIAGRAIIAYASLPRCSAVATIACSRGDVVRKLKQGNRVAYAALRQLRTFMDANQQVSAVAAFNSAVTALRELRAVAFVHGIEIKDTP